VVQSLQLPEVPPEGPWAAYVLVVIWLPLLLRVLFLLVPFRKAVYRLLPHTKWAFTQLRELPIRGIGLLAFNETIAFVIPPLVVFGIRTFSDPIGWQVWSEVSNTGLAILVIGFIFWIVLDFLRIARVRRMMKAIEKRDIDRMKKLADAGLKTRKWLRKFARKEEKETTSIEKGEEIAKKSVTKWGKRMLLTRKLSPIGLVTSVATSASIELARAGAGKISDAVDDRLQKEFDNIAKTNTKTLLLLLVRDLLMGIIPIIFLAYLPVLLG
jgi:hypothetical protein